MGNYNGGALDGNQSTGEQTGLGAGGTSTTGPIKGESVEAGNGLANQAVLEGAAAGSPPQIVAQGSDTDIGLTLTPKGTGGISVGGPLSGTSLSLTEGASMNWGFYAAGNVSTGANFIDAEAVGSLDTVGDGTITGALLKGLDVSRGGAQTGAFSDTTDTAADIYTAFGSVTGSVRVRILNTTGDTETILAGTGVTLVGTMTLAAGTWRDFLVQIVSGTAVTITNLGSGTI